MENNPYTVKQIKSLLELSETHNHFFNERFWRIKHILKAFSEGKKILWNGVEDHDFSFSDYPENYSIAKDFVEIQVKGKKFKINLTKAKEMGLAEEIS